MATRLWLPQHMIASVLTSPSARTNQPSRFFWLLRYHQQIPHGCQSSCLLPNQQASASVYLNKDASGIADVMKVTTRSRRCRYLQVIVTAGQVMAAAISISVLLSAASQKRRTARREWKRPPNANASWEDFNWLDGRGLHFCGSICFGFIRAKLWELLSRKICEWKYLSCGVNSRLRFVLGVPENVIKFHSPYQWSFLPLFLVWAKAPLVPAP